MLESGDVRANRVLAIASKAFTVAMTPPVGEVKPWRDATLGNPCKGVKRNPGNGGTLLYGTRDHGAPSRLCRP